VAKLVTNNYTITVNGTDFSDHLAACEFSISVDEQETTAFGSGYRSRIGSLKDASVTLSWHQDFGAASVDATLYPLLGSYATVVAKPTSGTVTATNPSYTGVFLVSQYTPISGSVGDLATFDTTWNIASGSVSRGTA
jgi:hypothetical protein